MLRVGLGVIKTTGWWFHIFFIFIPFWGRFPSWLIFFRWVGSTTNQTSVAYVHGVLRAMKWWNVLSMTALCVGLPPDTDLTTHQMTSLGCFLRVGKEGILYIATAISRLVAAGERLYLYQVQCTVRIIRPASNRDCDDGKCRYYIYIVYLPACLHTCIHTYIQTIKMQVTWTLMVDPQLTAMTYKGVVTVITVIYVHDVQSCSLLFGVMFLFLLAIRGCFENCSSSALTSRYTIYGLRYKQEQLLQRRHHHVFVLCFVHFKELIK